MVAPVPTPSLPLPLPPPADAGLLMSARVALTHPNPLLADLLHLSCVNLWGCTVVVRASSTESAFPQLTAAGPDLILAGLTERLPEILIHLRRVLPSARLILLVPVLNEYIVHFVSRLELPGIAEEASASLDGIAAAMAAVRAGHRHLCSRYIQLAMQSRQDPRSFIKLLTPQQETVLRCIAHAMDDDAIASRLGIIRSTAKRHRANLMHKLDLHSLRQLTHQAQRLGFNSISPPPRTPARRTSLCLRSRAGRKPSK